MHKILPAWAAVLSLMPLSASAADLPLTSFEQEEPTFAADVRQLQRELVAQIKGEYTDKSLRVFRDAHPRGIGCVAANFIIEPNLDAKFHGGVFATPGKSYDAIIRFSSSLGPAGDNAPDARGMAIKVFGVPGKKLFEPQADATTQDFVQINHQNFPTKTVHDFAGLAHAKTDKASLPTFLKENVITHTLELVEFYSMSKFNPDNGKSLAEMQFYSQVPYLLNTPTLQKPVKWTSRPCPKASAHIDLDGSSTELRDDLEKRLTDGEMCYEFALQFYRPEQGDEIENGMSDWGTDPELFTKVATIKIPKQVFKTDQKLRYCDNLSFQPWHTSEALRPLGNINRARKVVYETVSKYRHETNGEQSNYLEPTDVSAFKALTDPAYTTWNIIKLPQSTMR